MSFTDILREHTSAAIVLSVLFIWWNAVFTGSIFFFLKVFCWFSEKQESGELILADPSVSEAAVWLASEEDDDYKKILQFVGFTLS